MTQLHRAPSPAPDAAPCQRPARLRLHDSRVVAFGRMACAADPTLGAPVLAGGWGSAAQMTLALAPLARTAVGLAIAAGELRAARRCAVELAFAQRLSAVLAAARSLPGGRNSLAEYLGGRIAARHERLVVVPRRGVMGC